MIFGLKEFKNNSSEKPISASLTRQSAFELDLVKRAKTFLKNHLKHIVPMWGFGGWGSGRCRDSKVRVRVRVIAQIFSSGENKRSN